MSAGEEKAADRLERALAEPIYAGAAYKPFGEMTAAEVASRATELEGAAGVAAMQRVASVAAVWRGLAKAMEQRAPRRSPTSTAPSSPRASIASG